MSALVEQRNGYVIRDRRGEAGAAERGRSAQRSGLSVDAGGYGLFQTPRNSAQMDFYRPRPWLVSRPGEVLDEYDWAEMLDFSRQLFAQRMNLGAAVVQKNLYAVGDAWKPHYVGRNEEWGKEAEEWLREIWYPNCDVRGGVFDFVTNLFLSGIAYDVDGDDLVIFTVDDNGFPKTKHVPSDSIGSRGHTNEVKGGWADGAKICNGIVTDRTGAIIGVNVLGATQDEDQVIDAYNCQLLYEPEWRSTSRGIPRVAKACLDWFDVEDIDTFLKRGVKLDSSIGLLQYNEAGEAPTGSDILSGRGTSESDTSVQASDIKVERRMGGEMLYMRASKGEKIESLKSERPHPNAEAFIARIERRGLLSVGWFYELIDPSKIGGAPVRMIQDEARSSVSARQRTLRKRALRKVQFAVAQGMKAGKVSKNYDGGDFLKWGFHLPKPITVDNGYDEQADRENLKVGSTTMAAVCEKHGGFWKDFRKQTLGENFNLVDCAMQIVAYAKKTYGWEMKPEQALDLMRRDSPNERKIVDEEQQQQNQGGGK